MFGSLWIKIGAAAAAVLAVIAAIAKVFYSGKDAGRREVTDEVRGETEALNARFKKIDAARPDFDAAVRRMRDRAGSDKD